jgi:hypothetical protein
MAPHGLVALRRAAEQDRPNRRLGLGQQVQEAVEVQPVVEVDDAALPGVVQAAGHAAGHRADLLPLDEQVAAINISEN